MLKYFLDQGLVKYSDKEITDWKEAVAESCQLLLDKKLIDQSYVDEIIQCVEEHGPYIVIVPKVAMPHSSADSEEVYGTAISFTKMKRPIQFDQEEKSASLFFTLAAKNVDQHMENIQKLSELLMIDGLIDRLADTDSIEDYRVVMQEYNL
ncbi:PTS sugar transporter subunit IIA [Enterococcus hirae]|uniref:PTS sugar transporter subunit IIA n=1 Tax=Enterococcus hirae TaxID=1354 RepID=UPI0013629019|nr:PTS sugar transporter subunit IIA [Enterococcus hirae]EMF0169960.1 PTS sugar transporter subunit IIA [Enterococcus hirae]EMF0424241.1 PTS sugar transporter subunit IIA [Enterococcus hirae]MCD4958149.1 PTS sugar transporter subunit IIA [Enterococcus hirae]MDT2652629.1 PTS sugar transporter subunit IIA [Enterococcus hirae]NBJ43123.1 PTS sugar transporter subunit IIA [Enterococcus hirae]